MIFIIKINSKKDKTSNKQTIHNQKPLRFKKETKNGSTNVLIYNHKLIFNYFLILYLRQVTNYYNNYHLFSYILEFKFVDFNKNVW